MMGNTATRIYIATALVLVIYGGNKLAKLATDPPEVEMPNWTFDELPKRLGDWTGVATKLDPAIASATDAKIIVNRAYRDKLDHVINLHTAMIENPTLGICHNPQICYLYTDWTNKIKLFEELPISSEKTIPVYVGLWEKEGEKVWVVYWYQLGPNVLFDRYDMGIRVHWSLAGKPKWPALIKVLLQTPALDTEDSKSMLLEFAGRIAKWENLPQHNNGL
jgi:hypothetical protein